MVIFTMFCSWGKMYEIAFAHLCALFSSNKKSWGTCLRAETQNSTRYAKVQNTSRSLQTYETKVKGKPKPYMSLCTFHVNVQQT